jgi:hypothetical protein
MPTGWKSKSLSNRRVKMVMIILFIVTIISISIYYYEKEKRDCPVCETTFAYVDDRIIEFFID